ncbi:hypothetical protein H7U40_18530, partial [Flavonifractor plautii]|nr:hypothetical protein [Flavonifractor plautii]
EPIQFDMDAEDAEAVLKLLPTWMQEEVQKSVTWKARTYGPFEYADEDGDLPF